MDKNRLKQELNTHILMASALREISPARLARMDYSCQQAHHAAVGRVNRRIQELTKALEVIAKNEGQHHA